jgi:hypothetical protein
MSSTGALVASINRVLGNIESAVIHQKATEEKLREVQCSLETYTNALHLAELCVQAESERAKSVEIVIDAGIKALFGDNNGFRYDYKVDQKTGKIKGMEPVLIEDGVEREPASVGAAMRAYTSFFQRLAFVLLLENQPKVFVFDEHPSNGDSSKPQKLVDFLTKLSETLEGIQFIFITHEDVEFPHTIQVYKDDKLTKMRVC